jgi:hypothetical protein
MGTAASHSAGAAVEGCYPIICFQDAKPIASDYVPQPLNSDLNVPYVRFIGHRNPLVPLRRHDTMASLVRYGYWTKGQPGAASTASNKSLTTVGHGKPRTGNTECGALTEPPAGSCRCGRRLRQKEYAGPEGRQPHERGMAIGGSKHDRRRKGSGRCADKRKAPPGRTGLVGKPSRKRL